MRGRRPRGGGDGRLGVGDRPRSTEGVELPTYAFRHERFWPQTKRARTVEDTGSIQTVAGTGPWDKVDPEESRALADSLGVGEEVVEEIVSGLAARRRERALRAQVDGWRYRVVWEAITPPPTVRRNRAVAGTPPGRRTGGARHRRPGAARLPAALRPHEHRPYVPGSRPCGGRRRRRSRRCGRAARLVQLGPDRRPSPRRRRNRRSRLVCHHGCRDRGPSHGRRPGPRTGRRLGPGTGGGPGTP